MTIVEAAVQYSAHGWRILPCRPDKSPWTANGLKDATANQKQIRAWWDRWPDALIGIRTHAETLILDVDTPGDGHEHDGTAALAKLEAEHGRLPDTPMDITGGGGTHYWFRLPDGVVLGNGRGGLPSGLDVRAGGAGYVIVPPSIHPNGTAYKWEEGRAIGDVPLAPVPDWLLNILKTSPQRPLTVAKIPDCPIPPERRIKRATAYLSKMKPAQSGRAGHVQTLKAAAAMCRGFMLPKRVALRLLKETYNPRCEPPWSEKDLRHKIDEAAADRPGAREWGYLLGDMVPEVIVNRQLRQVKREAWDATYDHTDLFVHGGRLTLAREAKLEPVTKGHLLNFLVDRADWLRAQEKKKETVYSPSQPPAKLPDMMLAMPDDRVKPLESLVTMPSLDSKGGLMSTSGYYPDEQCLVVLPPSLEGLSIPVEPTTDEVQSSMRLIDQTWLGEFPFAAKGDRAAALALVLLPFLRLYINANTPLHLIEAPSEGTGKSLLWELFTSLATGKDEVAQLTGCGDNENEIRKAITTARMAGRWYLVLDNEAGLLKSAQLAKAVTIDVWNDRILSQNLPFDASMRGLVWVVTGNNLALSRELLRRCLPCRLEANVPKPWTRTFRIADIEQWTQNHRKDLVTACLTIVQGWMADGAPKDTTTRFGKCERWAQVMGGLLGWLDVDGFLANLDTLHERAYTEDQEAADFISLWWTSYQDNQQPVHKLADLPGGDDALPNVLGKGLIGSQKYGVLGKWLKRVLGRVYQYRDTGSLLKVQKGSRAHNSSQYWLQQIEVRAGEGGVPLYPSRCSENENE